MTWVSGMTLSTTTPVIGGGVGATLTVENFGGYYPASTTWTYTVTYGGVTTMPATPPMKTLTGATLYLPAPGDYALTAVTTYQSTNPSAPPAPPTTYTANFTVAPPSTVTKSGGTNAPTIWGPTIEATSTVSSAVGKIGPYAAGKVQERIQPFLDYMGRQIGGGPDWYPGDAPSQSFYLAQGVLHDQMGGFYTQTMFDNTPIGTAFITYTQELRYVWKMTGFKNGQFQNHTFSVPLNSLDWEWVKVSATTWEIQ